MRVKSSFSSRVIIVFSSRTEHFKVGEIPFERQEPLYCGKAMALV
jgi:hypothetical protein